VCLLSGEGAGIVTLANHRSSSTPALELLHSPDTHRRGRMQRRKQGDRDDKHGVCIQVSLFVIVADIVMI
jgi:hypothetical protein